MDGNYVEGGTVGNRGLKGYCIETVWLLMTGWGDQLIGGDEV